jgi:hypothetical protein
MCAPPSEVCCGPNKQIQVPIRADARKSSFTLKMKNRVVVLQLNRECADNRRRRTIDNYC